MLEPNGFGHRGGPTRVVVCSVITATLMAGVPILSGPAEPVPQAGRSFRAIFEQYRSGGADDAVEEFSRWEPERVEREATRPPDARDLRSLAALALLYTEAGLKNERFGLPVRTVTLARPDGLGRLEEWRKLPWPPGDFERQKDLLVGPPSLVIRRVMSLEDFDVYSRTALPLIREIVRESRVQEDTALLQ